MASISSDPYFDNVVLLCHFNEKIATTNHVDDSLSNNVISNGILLTETQKKWGPASLDKSSVSSPSNINFSVSDQMEIFNFLADDFTIEIWMYCLSYTSSLTNNRCLFNLSYFLAGPYYSPLVCSITSTGALVLEGTAADGTGYWKVASGNTIPLNEWVHLAVTRKNGTIKGFIHGVTSLIKSGSSFTSVLSGKADFFWGNNFHYSISFLGGAYLDDLRVTKSVARYTEDFTPPTEEFPGGQAILLRIAGRITELGVPGAYKVRMHDQATGKLLQETVSGGDGMYAFDTYSEAPVYIVALDESVPVRSAAIASEIIPTAV